MGSRDNLKANWKEGESGNPAGRPKGSLNRSTIVKRWLEATENAKNPITGDSEKMSQEDIITLALIKKARRGDTQAYKALMDSGYGAPKQETTLTSTNTVNIGIGEWVEGTGKGTNAMDNFKPDDEKPEKGSGGMWNPTRNL